MVSKEHTWKRQGFKSQGEYLNHLAIKKGFKSQCDYLDYLAKQNLKEDIMNIWL